MTVKRENPGQLQVALPRPDATMESADAQLTRLTSMFDSLNAGPDGNGSAHPDLDEASDIYTMRASWGDAVSLYPFYERLLETMHSGAVFVDARLNIIRWSRAVRDLTGIGAVCAERRKWDPGLLRLRDENYKLITREKCPVVAAVTEGRSTSGRYLLVNANHEKIAIDLCASPVVGPGGEVRGATLALHDASSHVNLEERLESLNEKASQDGLTGVANRAEFDRTHAEWFKTHLERSSPYSLIISDLDFFKKINDTYGHQAGDEALIAFGELLREHCRSSDFVARYGGEEFVVLCADCDADTAAARAESIREALARHSHHVLNGAHLTASFGVTGLQNGDTAETMLRRADRALLQAKADGRNTVVHLGRPSPGEIDQAKPGLGWLLPWKDKPGKHLLHRRLLTPVPIALATEKLRGFVVNHAARVLQADDDRWVLQTGSKHLSPMRRRGERPTPLLVELYLEETHQDSERRPGCKDLCTAVNVTIRPKRQRDRRRSDADEEARQLLASLKSYLMA
jgi:diguanylate cyclase (GGDEF)-like protein